MKISCVADVLEIVKKERGHLEEIWLDTLPPIPRHYKFPHGIWFRGQSNAEWELIPSVFRLCHNYPIYYECPMYGESDVYHQFQLRQAGYRDVYKSAFDWLCFMRHYTLPTRLLDWSESILVALYFAVDDSEKSKGKDAKLFALSAKKLNNAVTCRELIYPPNMEFIYTPNNVMVGLRAEVATDAMMDRCKLLEVVVSRYEFGETDVKSLEEEVDKCSEAKRLEMWLKYLVYPIAVYPFRLNARMTFQESVFTLHGGKCYVVRPVPENSIPEPVKLECLNEKQKGEDKFLKSFIIPYECKEEIKDELERIGIHEGTLFPELEYQASYIKRRSSLSSGIIEGNLLREKKKL